MQVPRGTFWAPSSDRNREFYQTCSPTEQSFCSSAVRSRFDRLSLSSLLRTKVQSRSSPRRKKRYQTESWLPGLTHALVKECVARKEQVQTGNPPTNLWKEICDSITKLAFECGWQGCREKFESITMFFEQSLLKVWGKRSALTMSTSCKYMICL